MTRQTLQTLLLRDRHDNCHLISCCQTAFMFGAADSSTYGEEQSSCVLLVKYNVGCQHVCCLLCHNYRGSSSFKGRREMCGSCCVRGSAVVGHAAPVLYVRCKVTDSYTTWELRLQLSAICTGSPAGTFASCSIHCAFMPSCHHVW